MRAFVIDSHGDAGNLRLADIDPPEMNAGAPIPATARREDPRTG